MKILLNLVILASVLALTLAQRQTYTGGCGLALEDIPDPASDSCVAFYRCYNNRQYSLRCPLGQAFHFDRARCRPEAEVDCPLQLQRFQAPAVPHYLRPPQAQQEREVEIRVVHVAPSTGTNNIHFNSGGQVPVINQATSQQTGQITSQGQAPQITSQFNGQQTPFLFRTANGHIIQTQGAQGHAVQGQAVQGQAGQTQYIQPPFQQQFQGQIVQGQNIMTPQHNLHHIQGPNLASHANQNGQGQTVQGHNVPFSQQSYQGQTVQGQVISHPQQQSSQGQLYQGQNVPPPVQQSSQGQAVQSQTIPSPVQQSAQDQAPQVQNILNPNPQIPKDQTVQGHNNSPPPPKNAQGQVDGQTNLSIFAPSSELIEQTTAAAN